MASFLVKVSRVCVHFCDPPRVSGETWCENANKCQTRDPHPSGGAIEWLGALHAAAGRKRTFLGVKKNVPRGQEPLI